MQRFLILSLSIALTLISGCATFYYVAPSGKTKPVSFETKPMNTAYGFQYADTVNNVYLRLLRHNYGLATIASNYTHETDKIKAILDWTHKQWKHDGSNTPSKPDPLTILREAKEGKNFRCVEYGIVVTAALSSIGIPARVLSLKTADAKRVKYGAGHVAAEAYSTELKKWLFIDGQFNAIPVLNSIPLNAVEFQKAIRENLEELKIVSITGEFSKAEKDNYINWIHNYLFYFDIKFNNRHEFNNQIPIDSKKTSLMLVPVQAKHLTTFQRKFTIDYCLYTNNINDFYHTPKSEISLRKDETTTQLRTLK
jgi:hypothetical protein